MVSPGINIMTATPGLLEGERALALDSGCPGGGKVQKIPWTVVGMHTLCLSMVRYGCQAGQDFTNTLIDAKADLVLTGHDHI